MRMDNFVDNGNRLCEHASDLCNIVHDMIVGKFDDNVSLPNGFRCEIIDGVGIWIAFQNHTRLIGDNGTHLRKRMAHYMAQTSLIDR